MSEIILTGPKTQIEKGGGEDRKRGGGRQKKIIKKIIVAGIEPGSL